LGNFKWPKAEIAELGPMICTKMCWHLRRIAHKLPYEAVKLCVRSWDNFLVLRQESNIVLTAIEYKDFQFLKLKYRHKYRYLWVSCRFIELWSNLVSLRLPSHSTSQ
jgi:hypothetical protein